MLGAIGDADRPLTQREILERSVALIEKQFTRDPRIAVDLPLPIAGSILNARRHRTRIRGDATRRHDCDRER